MRPITPDLLHQLSLNGNVAVMAALAPELEAQLGPGGIDTPLRVAHFLGQACVETWMFKRLEENLSYSAERIGQVWPRLAARGPELANNPKALGNAAYAGLNGNGDEASGDGWLYRGRGLFCLTGRANYREIGRLLAPSVACGTTSPTLRAGEEEARVDIETEPDLVSQPHWAVATAVAFWNERRINEAADEDDISKVTRLVNGGTEGIAERAILKHRALALLAKF